MFNSGDEVEVRIYETGEWKPAILGRRSTYQPNYGGVWWEYSFDPLPGTDPKTGIFPSQGGQTNERSIRRKINAGA